MRTILKGVEPRSLTEHRAKTHSDYDNYTDKDGLRGALEREQRGLCCYCMSRIRPDGKSMKIEHWQSQARYPDRQLNYANLLGACLGGEGQPARRQHCDTKKGDKDLKWNPANPDHHIQNRVRYEPDGSVRADDKDFDEQIDDVLNLNLPVLKNKRKAILDSVLDGWKRQKARIGGPVPRQHLIQKREEYASGIGELEPFCQIAVWWLDQRLKRLPA